ncbi:hypothetical protein D9M69_673250 [compost metagenome]
MPMDRVSRSRFSPACSSARRAKAACCVARSSLGWGIVINPRSLRLGSCVTACASAGNCSGLQPDLLASPLIFTCRQIFSAGRCAGRCADRRSASFRRSTECTQAKCSAIARVLFD